MRWAKVAVTSTNGSSGHLLIGYFTQPARDEVASIMTTAAWAALLALLLIAGVGWVVAGQILAPVRTVRKAAAEISAHDLTQRIPVQRRDDIGELAETFNSMLDRLDDAFATQRQFLDDAGHELRTPITIVQGHLDVMGDDPADRDETLRLVTDELARMTRMVDDLLLLAKARRPDFVRPGPVALADLTSDIYRKVEQLGNRSWSVDSTSTDIVRVDAQRVTQALVQLAHNAVRHTRDGDRIELGSAVDDHVVTFWVADTGSGVSPADAQKIWERFTRIGLHGRGRGARVGHRESHRRSPRRTRHPDGKARCRIYFRNRVATMNRILIVEDSERIASFIQKGLRAKGFTTTVVGDGASAIDYAAGAEFDMIILDIGLPDRDGFSVLTNCAAPVSAPRSSSSRLVTRCGTR